MEWHFLFFDKGCEGQIANKADLQIVGGLVRKEYDHKDDNLRPQPPPDTRPIGDLLNELDEEHGTVFSGTICSETDIWCARRIFGMQQEWV